jgi:Tol biopolymer transport system component
MTLTAATRLGPYEILAPLGAGGMGEVYRARDPRLGREVAIKVLPEALADDPSRLGRFEREAKATGALNHPHILAIHDIGEHERRPYVVYELLEGQTLGERMSEGPLPSHEALTWATQVAQGLAAAHAKGIVHRDLKPENLFLTEAGPLKILDFGLAKVARPEADSDASIDPEDLTAARESLTAEGAVLGTVGYMSPEQVKGERADHRSDIFSLGVVLYEMLSGRRPFKGGTAPETMAAILKEDPPALAEEEVSPPIAEVVERCLAKEPDERFQSAHDLALALEVLAASVAETRSAVATFAPARTPVRWGRRLLLLASALVVVAGAVLGLRPLLAPSGELRLVGPRQVTTDGKADYSFTTDGTWLYYSTYDGHLFQVSVAGGEPREIDPWPDEQRHTYANRLSPADPRQLMVLSSEEPRWTGAPWLPPRPVWVLSLPAGTPRRLGDFVAIPSAIWSPDGERIAYSTIQDLGASSMRSDIFVADKDGTSSRKIATVDGAFGPVQDWSRDGWILYSVWSTQEGGRLEPWVVRPDGTQRHRLLPDWPDSYVHGIEWTPDERHILFISGDVSGGRFWALEEGHDEPVPLTEGPLRCWDLNLDPEGRSVYANCVKELRELAVYRAEVGEWAPYAFAPEPMAAGRLAYSRDGEWVAWTKTPEGTLWRGRRDGSQKLQLTEPGDLMASFKAWSPDGEWILFSMGLFNGTPTQLWVLSKDGQSLRVLAGEGSSVNRADWVPDGRVVASFALNNLRLIDPRTGESEEMPGTNGLGGVASSPDGRFLAAHDLGLEQDFQIRVLDWQSGEWRALEGAVGGMLQWSRDSRHLYYGCGEGEAPQLCRVSVEDGAIETVVDKMLPGTFFWHFDPEGQIVAPRGLALFDIYAWDLEYE